MPKQFAALKFEMMQSPGQPRLSPQWMIGASWFFEGDDKRSCWNQLDSLAECFQWAADVETALKMGKLEGNPA
jgi:hypothetical protein